MQASLARWAVVSLSTLGAIGCQGTKPGWWPGHKSPVYSNSSTTPPTGIPPQSYSQQQAQSAPAYDQSGYAQPGAQGAPGNYAAANGYPIGNTNAQQDQYAGMGGAANGANPYEQQQYGQQQPNGAYPESYQNGAAAGPGGGYAGQPAGYSQTQPYAQTASNPYAAGNQAGGYEQPPAGAAPANYGTASPYDATGGGYSQEPNTQPGGGYQQPPAQNEQQYQPGNTGYSPPGTQPYQSPGGAYNADPNAVSQADPHYRPGSTSDYSPAAAPATATTAANGYAPPAGGGGRYPQTGAGGPGGYPPQPPLDRYGRPTQEASNPYAGTMQR